MSRARDYSSLTEPQLEEERQCSPWDELKTAAENVQAVQKACSAFRGFMKF